MPHPLRMSIMVSGLMEEAESSTLSRDRSLPHPKRKLHRRPHSKESLLAQVCINAAHKASGTERPSPSKRSLSSCQKSSSHMVLGSPADLATAPSFCASEMNVTIISTTPPTFARNGPIPPTLPLEFLSTIITDHLKDDILTLKSLSQTCRYFCSITRPFIFQRLHLYMHPTLNQKRGVKLAELLVHGRHLIPFIHHVVVSSLFREDSYIPGHREDRDALRVLLNLSALRKVSVRGYSSKPWESIPTGVQLAIKTCLRGKGISTIEVTEMANFPVYLLEGCRSLKELVLSASPRCAPETEDEAATLKAMTFAVDRGLRNTSPIYLESLKVTMPTSDLARLTDWILSDRSILDISRVKTLHIRHRVRYSFLEHPVAISRLLETCCNTVNDLEMEVYTPGHTTDKTTPLSSLGPTSGSPTQVPCQPDAAEPTVEDVYRLLDISKLKAIRRLYVSFGIPNMWDQRSHLSLLGQMFRNLTRESTLKELGLFLWHGENPLSKGYSESRLSRKLHESGSWDVLDCALSGMGMEGGSAAGSPDSIGQGSLGLERVTVQLAGVRNLEQGTRLMGLCLPRLTAKGIVDVQDKIKRVVV